MADKLVDKVMLGIVPVLDDSEMSKQADKVVDSMEKTGEESGEKFSKGFFSKFKKGFDVMKGRWAKVAVTAGALAYGMKNTADKTLTTLEEKIALADTLGTTASQSGMKTEDFAKLYTLLRSGDATPEASIQTIREFSKRYGEFKKTGAKSEFFGGLKNQDVGKAFIEAVGVVGQEKDASKRAMLIDQMFGGAGVEQLAEFFTKDITKLMKESSNINYSEYGKAIESLSAQDDIIKKNRVELERQALIETAKFTGTEGGQFIADKEKFDQVQLMHQMNMENMKNVQTTTEAFTVVKNSLVEGTGTLTNAFKETVNSIKNYNKALDEGAEEVRGNTSLTGASGKVTD